MPRYHFHSVDGERTIDQDGLDLPDEAAARRQAIAFAGEVLRYSPDTVCTQSPCRVEVTDASGHLLFTVVTLGIDAPPRESVRRSIDIG